MNAQQWTRIKEIFDRVRDVTDADRPGAISTECRGDAELEAALTRIIEADGATSPLDDPPAALGLPSDSLFVDAPSPPHPLPIRVGRYRIQSVLGTGTYGIVYRVTDEMNGQSLALKVLRTSAPTPHIRRRFEYEARAITELSHPFVARVYEASASPTAQGDVTPYIAMELIHGIPITEYVTTNRVPHRQILELFVRVCSAVSHAHQRGIIHRDLKPHNILVDVKGTPKLLDFGLAKFVEGDGSSTGTATGQLLGTPEYMSPEQASGDPDRVDTRSDIYSLGAVLYELLGGRPPLVLESLGMLDAVRAVAHTDPLRLGALSPACRGDLETIAAKALAKELERRYQTVQELAGDIERFLAEKPVLARPASWSYLFQKFARRHRTLVGAAAVVALAILTAVVSVGVAQHKEVQGYRVASELAATLLTQVVGPSWDSIGSVEDRRKLLAQIRGQVEELASRFPDDRPMQLNRARLLERLRDQAESDGNLVALEQYAGQTLAIYAKLADGRVDDKDRHIDLSVATVRMGDAMGGLRRHNDQEAFYRKALKLDQAMHERWPADGGIARNLAFSYSRLGYRALARADVAEGVRLQEQAVSLVQTIPASELSSFDARWARWSLLACLSEALSHAGDIDRSDAVRANALPDIDWLVSADPGSRRFLVASASARLGLADSYRLRLHDLPGAQEYWSQAEVIMRKLLELDPTDQTVKELWFAVQRNQIGLAHSLKDSERLRRTVELALAAAESLAGTDSREIAEAENLACVYHAAVAASREIGPLSEQPAWVQRALQLSAAICQDPAASRLALRASAWFLLVTERDDSPSEAQYGLQAVSRLFASDTPMRQTELLLLAIWQNAQGQPDSANATLDKINTAPPVRDLDEPGRMMVERLRREWR